MKQAEYQKKHTGVEKTEKTPGLKAQLSCCLKSRTWIILMVYAVLSQVVNALFSASAIYYCNWILGSYNDGRTQSLFYALGQFPMGFGIFLAAPLAMKFGKKNVITGGFILSVIGTVICLVAPTNLMVVMSGQIIRSFGSIPCSYLFAGLFGDALDDVEIKSGKRCDGFASSVFNSIITLSGGISLFIFNLGIGKLGYVSPALGADVVQPDAVKNFILFCVMGLQVIIYPVMAVLFAFMPKEKKEIANEEVKEVA